MNIRFFKAAGRPYLPYIREGPNRCRSYGATLHHSLVFYKDFAPTELPNFSMIVLEIFSPKDLFWANRTLC
jgi:hypothetical protein